MQLRATRLTAIASAVKRAFNISSLFAGGVQGLWYDPSDYTTLFQDSAGTTPVTAVEQPVGLMLDKSQGLVLGPELVTNGDFSNGSTGWTYIAGTTNSASVVSGQLVFTAAVAGPTYATYRQSVLTVGKWYQIEFDLISTAAGGNSIYIEAGGSGIEVGSTLGRRRMIRTAVGTNLNIIGIGGGTIDNISVKELPGNHAFQSTSASRPVLSARYNLLTKTEQFNDAAWVKDGATISANAVTAPDGTLTADKLVESDTTAQHRCYYQISLGVQADYFDSIYLKKGERDWAYVYFGSQRWAYFNLNAGATGTKAAGTTSSITSVGDGWYLCSVVGNSTATLQYFIVNSAPSDLGVSAPSYTGDGTSGIYIWGASLLPANQADLPYQRVNTSTDYATTGFLPYLKFDGVDDSLSTNSISFTSTDKMSVFAGVRKLSDAAVGVIAELSTSAGGGTSGTFVLHGQTSPVGYRYAAGSGSSGAAFATDDASVFTAPITNVVTGISNFAGATLADEISVRVNGVAPTQTLGGFISTGNFGNYPLYIGRRGVSSLPFNGQLYSMTIVGKQVTATELSSTEKYTAAKTGVTL